MGHGRLQHHRTKAAHCVGKTPFLSVEEARAASPTQTAYPCSHCGAVHLTSSEVIQTKPRKSKSTRRFEARKYGRTAR